MASSKALATLAKSASRSSAEAVYKSVMDVVRDGDIILMHENAEYTVEVLPRILAALKEQGYQVVTVSELIYAGSDIKAAAEGN